MDCPACQQPPLPGDAFCRHCGASLPVFGFCTGCGQPVEASSRFCRHCGTPVGAAGYAAPPVLAEPSEPYASFWPRVGAYLVDGLIVSCALGIPFTVVFFVVAAHHDWPPQPTAQDPYPAPTFPHWIWMLYLVYYLVQLIASWLYYALLESGPQQATFGKRALGIYVGDERGERISFARASGRYFSLLVSAATVVGLLMPLWTERRQGLHDKLAGTLVLRQPRRY